ncbi:MAG: trypsin-like peptidase domain-containing protein [Deltaproteobacteria bacterium]
MTGRRSLLVVVLLAGLVGGVALTASLDRSSPSTADEITTRPAILPVGNSQGRQAVGLPDFSVLAEAISPSVVNIATVLEDPAESGRRRGGKPESFEHFFPRRGPSKSLGSGFILDEEGYIVTNHHVVEDATTVIVKLQDESEHEAKVVGADPKTDIAVIKIEKVEGLRPLALGDSEALKVGEWVLAIGNPFGLDHTVTAGIVSAKGRRIKGPSAGPYDDFIQTDAAINPGNSGGPLVNMSGQVVGINSAIMSPRGGNIGIGFAIPIDMVRRIVPQLKKDGKVTRGWLGVLIQPVSEDIAESLGLPEANGALVAKVFADSPAEKGGRRGGRRDRQL